MRKVLSQERVKEKMNVGKIMALKVATLFTWQPRCMKAFCSISLDKLNSNIAEFLAFYLDKYEDPTVMISKDK